MFDRPQLLLIFSTLSSWLFCSASPAVAQPPPAPVVVDAVRSEMVQEWRTVTGEVRARRRARVATRESGPLLELRVREGERVEAGAVLGSIESVRLDIELAQAAADSAFTGALVEERSAEVDFAKKDLSILQELDARNAANPKEMLDAETALLVAAARLRQAERQIAVIAQRMKLIEKRLADTQIVAPFSGTVTARHTQIGEWLAAGAPVVSLISDREIEIWLSTPQRYYAALGRPGVSVTVTAEGPSQFISTSLSVVPEIDSGTRNFPVIVRVDDPEQKLAPGMSVSAIVPTGDKMTAVTVHRDAILRGDTGAFVFMAQGGSDGPASAVMVPIKERFAVGDRVVVSGPLTPGSNVVIEGNERLFPMAPILPKKRAAPRAKGEGAASESGTAGGRTP